MNTLCPTMLDLLLITLSFSQTEAFRPVPHPLIVRAISPKRKLIWAWLQHVGVLGSTGWSCGLERAANWSKQDSAGLVFVFTLLERRPLEQTASVSSHVAENHPNLHSLLFGTTNTQPVCPDGPAFQISHCFCPLSPPCAVASLKVSVSGRCKNRVPREGAENNLVAFKDKVLPLFTWPIYLIQSRLCLHF